MKTTNYSISLLLLCAASAAAQSAPIIKPYARSVDGGGYEVKPLLSVGNQVPHATNSAETYQFCGIPDGLGAKMEKDGLFSLYVNHEFGNAVQTEPIIGQSRIRGAYVSKFMFDRKTMTAVSGQLAYTKVSQDSSLVGDIASTANTTPAFGRFCSATLAGRDQGFTQDVFFTGEESDAATSFNGKGGSAVAIMSGTAYALSGMGHYAKENVIPMTATYLNKVVCIITEDGPATAPFSGVMMYVGDKNKSSINLLERNGLSGGKLYYLRAKDSTRNSEINFNGENTSVPVEWVLAPNASTQTETELKSEMTAASFFQFSRPEDGDFDPRNRYQFHFVTTGGDNNGNTLGRFYTLALNKTYPAGDALLTLHYDADLTSAANDGAVSPDNMATSARGISMLQEDGTSQSRVAMNTRNRNASIWAYDNIKLTRTRVVELTDIGQDGLLANPGSVVGNGYRQSGRGIWESSGIISTPFLGANTWIFDVQAHKPTAAPGIATEEDGQILFMIKRY